MKLFILVAFFILTIPTSKAQKIYSVDKDYKADVKVFVVNSDYKAELKIYFVESAYKAGWKNKSKIHLMY